LLYALPAISEPCADANALGTSRTLAVDPARLSRIGTMQYRETVALAPKEVVLTFDDGPMQPMTSKVLEALRAECVNATFFLVGRYARAHPEVVREIARDGHTIANHTENHPLVTMGEAHGIKEFETGFFSVATVLEPVHVSPAPFIRFPGLFSTAGVEAYAKRKGLTVMSADLLADDWLRIPAEQIFVRAMARLSQKGSGILLLHDVQPGTALILPKLLNELKTRGYRIVHLVPAPGTDPVIAAAPLVAEKPAPPPPVRHAVHRHVAAKPIDASNIHTAAEAIGHDKTSAASDNKVPRASVSTITPVAASAGALPEGTIFGRWRKTMQERRGAVAITRPEP
jgi:peptidoglycan/xylan/chitin deacetylase (PgdA/CDA1 family)